METQKVPRDGDSIPSTEASGRPTGPHGVKINTASANFTLRECFRTGKCSDSLFCGAGTTRGTGIGPLQRRDRRDPALLPRPGVAMKVATMFAELVPLDV